MKFRVKNPSKNVEKIKNLNFFTVTNYTYYLYTENQYNSTKTSIGIVSPTIWVLGDFRDFGQFLTQNLGFRGRILMKFRGFSDFFEILPILRSHKYFSTEPIWIFLDSMKSHGSDSFISAILETQNKIRVPPEAHLWTGFWKIPFTALVLHL